MRQWTIDAFTDQPFLGNSACVLEPMGAWPSDDWMQRLAAENNAGATAFLARTDRPDRFGIRWFTPSTEVPLCGHATLASAHALLAEMGSAAGLLAFDTASGEVTARAGDGGYELSFPIPPFERIATPAGLGEALGAEPDEVWQAPYLVAIYNDPRVIGGLQPRLSDLRRISADLGGQGNVGVAALAPATAGFDAIDRFFAPGYGFREDPATGSFHAILTPILAARLGSSPIRFRQAYPGRGADLTGRLEGGRVVLSGRAVTVSEAVLRVRPPEAAR
ncbi:PhzF family phenazine biosynthesis protein [Phenylobacterium sp.]|uniref:PhzF family phenazine biosynthesis protein n=1 Tax=Phenylobacterium sp. TaxID=1871053 RepID=UPI0025DC91DD|nr:PhzF family phenazine biosynthesis protein [Phenylobacterium sp.]